MPRDGQQMRATRDTGCTSVLLDPWKEGMKESFNASSTNSRASNSLQFRNLIRLMEAPDASKMEEFFDTVAAMVNSPVCRKSFGEATSHLRCARLIVLNVSVFGGQAHGVVAVRGYPPSAPWCLSRLYPVVLEIPLLSDPEWRCRERNNEQQGHVPTQQRGRTTKAVWCFDRKKIEALQHTSVSL